MNRSRLLFPVLVLAGASILAAAPVNAGGRPVSASLAATNEVAPAAPGQVGATGSAAVTLNQGRGEICFEIDSNVTGPTAAHIHEAPVGKNGPIVVTLSVTDGCVSADRVLVKEIRQNPAGFYVNVHSTANPLGAVRGQLAP
ncbi:MAG: CHRD domain-containing protein [Ilumatobacter sp.]